MTTRSKSKSRSRNSSKQDKSAFSWASDHAGTLAGAAAAGAVLGFAAHFGRKAVMQGMEASAGDWEAMLKKDHDEILGIFDQMLATDSSQTFKRSALLMKLAHKLDKHAYEEENVIYPALRDDNDTKQADDLDMEHGHIKTFIFELKQMDADARNWLEKVRNFRDLVSEHIRMEEEQVFPAFREDLNEDKSAKLTMMVNKAGFMMA